jgi:hypothetical protein
MTCTFSDFKMLPDDTKLPLLAMMNWLFASSVTSLETLCAPVSVKSIAISSKLLAEGIFAYEVNNIEMELAWWNVFYRTGAVAQVL